MSWDWVQHGLGPMWKPFLVGCGLTGALFGLVGYALLDVAVALQRAQEIPRTRRARPAAISCFSTRFPRFDFEDAVHARREAPVVRHHDEAGRRARG